jgi:hypothetical protein
MHKLSNDVTKCQHAIALVPRHLLEFSRVVVVVEPCQLCLPLCAQLHLASHHQISGLLASPHRSMIAHRECCVVAKLPHTNNERKQKTRRLKLRRMHKWKTKSSFSTVNFSKADPLCKCWSASFYRETNKIFAYRDYPHVKRINIECARLILGSLH